MGRQGPADEALRPPRGFEPLGAAAEGPAVGESDARAVDESEVGEQLGQDADGLVALHLELEEVEHLAVR